MFKIGRWANIENWLYHLFKKSSRCIFFSISSNSTSISLDASNVYMIQVLRCGWMALWRIHESMLCTVLSCFFFLLFCCYSIPQFDIHWIGVVKLTKYINIQLQIVIVRRDDKKFSNNQHCFAITGSQQQFFSIPTVEMRRNFDYGNSHDLYDIFVYWFIFWMVSGTCIWWSNTNGMHRRAQLYFCFVYLA